MSMFWKSSIWKQFALIIGGALFMTSHVQAQEVRSERANGAATDSIVLGMGCFWGAEKRMAEIAVMKTHIINYVKTKDVLRTSKADWMFWRRRYPISSRNKKAPSL